MVDLGCTCRWGVLGALSLGLAGVLTPRAAGAVDPTEALSLASLNEGHPLTGSIPPAVPPKVEPAADDWLGQYESWKQHLQEKTGTSYELYVNLSSQIMAQGPSEGDVRNGVFWNLNVTQQLWVGAKAIMNVRGGDGKGLTRYLAADMFNTNHFLGEPTGCYVSHLYLEQKLWDDKITLAAGKLDLADYFDTNSFGSWDFFAYPHARNPIIPVPYHVLGALGRWDIVPWLYVQAGIADNDGVSTQSGFNTAFSGHSNLFTTGEVGVRPEICGRRGTYRMQVWYTPEASERIDGSGLTRDDWGIALNVEQPITDALGVYGRYGCANGHIHNTDQFVGGGLTYSGLLLGKDRDVLGAGVGLGVVSDDYREVQDASATTTIFEFYYKIKITRNLAVTPDVQLLLNPGASSAESTATIAGISMELRF